MRFGVTSYGEANAFASAKRLKPRHGVCDAIDVDVDFDFGWRNNDVENVAVLPFELVVQRLDDGAQEHATDALGIPAPGRNPGRSKVEEALQAGKTPSVFP